MTPAFYITNGFPDFPRPPLIDPTLDNGSDVNFLAREDGTPPRVNYWNLNVLIRHSETLRREYRALWLDYPEGFVEINEEGMRKYAVPGVPFFA